MLLIYRRFTTSITTLWNSNAMLYNSCDLPEHLPTLENCISQLYFFMVSVIHSPSQIQYFKYIRVGTRHQVYKISNTEKLFRVTAPSSFQGQLTYFYRKLSSRGLRVYTKEIRKDLKQVQIVLPFNIIFSCISKLEFILNILISSQLMYNISITYNN